MDIILLEILLIWCLTLGGAVYRTRRELDVKCDRSVDIAIVGAGIAGTYFAYKLRDAGLDIELLEYSDRIGGRLFTTSLPNIPDINLEMGGMRFIDGEHKRVQRLVKEFKLTPIDFVEGFGKPERTKYYLRKKEFRFEDLRYGEVPYKLSPEEKLNQGNIVHYYLQKLIGYNGKLADEQALMLKTKDGRELYKLTMDEALDMVATSGGRRFMTEAAVYDSSFFGDVSAVEYFVDFQTKSPLNKTILTLKEGMTSIPKSLVNAFLQSSTRHRISLNRKLEAINSGCNGLYQLLLMKTTTVNGLTMTNGTSELLCSKKVILAIPQFALTQLKWKPLRFPNVKEALFAVTPIKANKIYLTFPESWWLRDSANLTFVMKSDVPFRQMYDWKSSNISGDCVMLASYTDSDSTIHLENMNSEDLAPGSTARYNKVSNRLKQELLRHLTQAFRVDRRLIPEPSNAISQFWTTYPYGGGWTVWRAGYNFSDVRQTIRRPSLIDDVYIVGSDHGFVGNTIWIEGAMSTVDEVYDKYFN